METRLGYCVNRYMAQRDYAQLGIAARDRVTDDIDVDALTNEQREILWQAIGHPGMLLHALYTRVYMPQIDVYDYESLRLVDTIDLELFDDIDADEWFAIAARVIQINADSKKRFDDACATRSAQHISV